MEEIFLLLVLLCICSMTCCTASMPQVASGATPKQRIVNGFDAAEKQFPYQLFMITYQNSRQLTCGAVLVSNRMVLTAAHCVDEGTTGVDLYFGILDKVKFTRGRQRLRLSPRDIVVHPRWDKYNTLNDIAIIHLPADIEFTEHIQPVKLPEPNQSYEGLDGIASGFGRSHTGTSHLQYYNVSTISNEDCRSIIENHMEDRFFSSSFLCLKPSDSSPCSGDSGGPFVVPNEDGSKTLLGITSFGITDKCEVNFPGIYTRVTSYLDWIEGNRIGDHCDLMYVSS